jgi:hypothetical protein
MFLAEPVVGAQGCGSWVRGVALGIDFFFFARQDEWKQLFVGLAISDLDCDCFVCFVRSPSA